MPGIQKVKREDTHLLQQSFKKDKIPKIDMKATFSSCLLP